MIAEKRIPITLAGEDFRLYFNANTMVAYEEKTGKNYLETVARLYDVYKPILDLTRSGQTDGIPNISGMDVVKAVPMSELSALIWAGLHEYDKNEEPVWPLTLAQVRRRITLGSIPQLFLAFLNGQAVNSPTETEMGESRALSAAAVRSENSATAPNGTTTGGEPSIALPEDAFA